MKALHGYFLIQHENSYRKQDGIGKKMRAQIAVFNEAGLSCEPYFFRVNREMETLSPLGKAAYLLPYSNFCPRWEYDEKLAQADFLYFRHPPAVTGPLRRLLRQLKERKPSLKVVMEIPTYPYEGETKGAAAALIYKDRYNRERLRGLVDALAIVGSGEEETIWGLPVLWFSNGCRLSEISAVHTREDGCIDLLAVARFSRWHGYDRLLEGLGRYYRGGGERDIRIHLVGESSDGTVEELRAQAARLDLEERVIFYGFRNGEALDAIYDRCDIGVSTLGLHRKGIGLSSDLKSREYIAKGLPQISGTRIDVFDGVDSPFYREFPADESPIDMEEVAAFYDSVYPPGCDRSAVNGAVRAFAEAHCDMGVTMGRVLDFLRGEDKPL